MVLVHERKGDVTINRNCKKFGQEYAGSAVQEGNQKVLKIFSSRWSAMPGGGLIRAPIAVVALTTIPSFAVQEFWIV